MEESKNKGLPMLTKVYIIVNVLLFGITGVVYLTRGNNAIGFVLLAAGAINILYILMNIKTNSLLSAVLNFIFALASLIVCIDYLTHENINFGIIWLVIGLIYLVIGFILLLRSKKKK